MSLEPYVSARGQLLLVLELLFTLLVGIDLGCLYLCCYTRPHFAACLPLCRVTESQGISVVTDSTRRYRRGE